MIELILFLIAAICFLLVGVGVSSARVNLLGFGLFFFALAFVLGAAGVT